MRYTADRIKAELIEAADIEHRMRGPRGPSGPRTAWPVHRREADDVAGHYVGEFADDDVPPPVTGAEQTAHAKVTTWLREHIANDADRRLLWSWAASTARGAFVDFCREGRLDQARTMARVDRVAEGIAAKLIARDNLPHPAGTAIPRRPLYKRHQS